MVRQAIFLAENAVGIFWCNFKYQIKRHWACTSSVNAYALIKEQRAPGPITAVITGHSFTYPTQWVTASCIINPAVFLGALVVTWLQLSLVRIQMFGGSFFTPLFPPKNYKLIFQIFHSKTSGLPLPSTDLGEFISFRKISRKINILPSSLLYFQTTKRAGYRIKQNQQLIFGPFLVIHQ